MKIKLPFASKSKGMRNKLIAMIITAFCSILYAYFAIGRLYQYDKDWTLISMDAVLALCFLYFSQDEYKSYLSHKAHEAKNKSNETTE